MKSTITPFLALFQNAKIQDLNVIHNTPVGALKIKRLFQNAKIQDLNVIHNHRMLRNALHWLFQNAKIQDLNVIYYRINSKESVL